VTGSEVATTTGRAPATSAGALAVRPDQTEWTPAQHAALEQLGISDASRGDLDVFLHVSQRMGLDPFAKEIYLIGRWDPELRRKRWTIQVGIEGYRSKSEEHPQFAGVSDAEWCGPDGVWSDVWLSDDTPPVAARVTVYRKDWAHPVRAVAHYREYVQLKQDGTPTAMWKNRAAGQLAKCAEALARRRAFPRILGGTYIPEETDHLSNPAAVTVPSIPDRSAQPAEEPNWVAMVTQAEYDRDLAELRRVWDMAKGMCPNDAELLDRIAQAVHRVRAIVDKQQGQEVDPAITAAEDVEPANRTDRNRLFALLRDGGIASHDRALRLRIVSRVLNRPPARPLMTFDELTAHETRTVNEFMQRHKDDGDLTQTLAELAGSGDSPTLDNPAEVTE
jgi:phage recombination protein Bet